MIRKLNWAEVIDSKKVEYTQCGAVAVICVIHIALFWHLDLIWQVFMTLA